MERKSTKRRRAALACDSCRRKKIRCDTNRPACDNCVHSRIKCVYTEVLRKKPPPAPRRNDTSSRLDRIESALYSLLKQRGGPAAAFQSSGTTALSSDNSDADSGPENDHDDGVDSLCDSSDDFNGKTMGENVSMIRLSQCDEGHIYTHAIAGTFLSQKSLKWLEDKIDDPALFERLRLSIQGIFNQQQQRITRYTENILNPMTLDVEFMRAALRYFAAANLPFVNSLLTPREAEELSKMKYETMSLASRLLACSVTVLMSYWMGREEVASDLKYSPEYLQRQGFAFLSHAGKYAQTLSLAVPNMNMMRAYVMFVMALDKLQMPPTALFYTMLSMNVALSMGMNRIESYRGMSEEAKMRRNATWWLVYIFERDMSIKLGRAPMVPDSEISAEMLDLSSGKDEFICAAYFIQLSRIYGKVYRKLFSVAAQSRSRAQHFQDVVSLSHELEAWKQRLPEQYQLSDNFNYHVDSNSISDLSFKKMVIWLHSSYYEVTTTVNRIAAFSQPAVQTFLKRLQDPTRTNQNSPINANGSNGAGSSAGNGSVNSVTTPTDSPQISEEDAARLLSAMDVCRDSARRILALSQHLLDIGCGSLISSAVMYLTGAFVTLFAASMTDPTSEQSNSDRELMRKYLPLFTAQKFVSSEVDAYPITEFWSSMLEILDKYRIKLESGGDAPAAAAAAAPQTQPPPAATDNVAAPVPTYSAESYAALDPSAGDGFLNQRMPSVDGWMQDSLLLDPEVEGSANWIMRDAFDGMYPGMPKQEDRFSGNFGELANDMYMMSGFYGT